MNLAASQIQDVARRECCGHTKFKDRRVLNSEAVQNSRSAGFRILLHREILEADGFEFHDDSKFKELSILNFVTSQDSIAGGFRIVRLRQIQEAVGLEFRERAKFNERRIFSSATEQNSTLPKKRIL